MKNFFNKIYNWLVAEDFLKPGLNFKELIKGLAVAIGGTIVTMIYQVISLGSFNFNWHAILIAAVTAGIAYLMKNIFENSNGEFLKKEPTPPVKK
jgi:hypothetical protein